MKNGNVQMAIFVAVLLGVVLAVKLLPSGPSESQSSQPEVAKTRELPPSTLPVGEDLVGEDEYTASATTSPELFPERDHSQDIDEDDELSETECRTVMAHIQKLDGQPANGETKKGIEAACKEKGELTASFARCAVKQKTKVGLLKCTGDIPKATQDAEEIMKKYREAD